MAITCTPAAMLASTPCTRCLSETEMLGALGYVIAKLNGVSVATTAALVDDSKCFDCLSEKQSLEAILNGFYAIAVQKGNIPTGTNLKSVSAASTIGRSRLRAILVKQICGLLNRQ